MCMCVPVYPCVCVCVCHTGIMLSDEGAEIPPAATGIDAYVTLETELTPSGHMIV